MESNSNPEENHVSTKSMPHVVQGCKPAVHLVGGDALVWSVEDARQLREQHRVVAGPIGSLPRNPLQNIFLSLPLKLQPEEVYTLLKRGMIRVIDEANAYERPHADISQQPSSESTTHGEENDPRSARSTSITIRTLSSWLPWYRFRPLDFQGLQASSTSDNGVGSSSVVIKECLPSLTTIILSIEITSLSDPRMDQLLQFPKTKRDFLRLRMYEYLWESNTFYIAPGFKFGGDYLLYALDPLTCHAGWIASVKSLDEIIAIRDIASMARLASSVQKSHVLCSFQDEAIVDQQGYLSNKAPELSPTAWCFSVDWAGF